MFLAIEIFSERLYTAINNQFSDFNTHKNIESEIKVYYIVILINVILLKKLFKYLIFLMKNLIYRV